MDSLGKELPLPASVSPSFLSDISEALRNIAPSPYLTPIQVLYNRCVFNGLVRSKGSLLLVHGLHFNLVEVGPWKRAVTDQCSAGASFIAGGSPASLVLIGVWREQEWGAELRFENGSYDREHFACRRATVLSPPREAERLHLQY